jgi:tight adherence protein B
MSMWIIALLVFASSFWIVLAVVRRVMTPRIVVSERLSYYGRTAAAVSRAPGRWSGIPAADRLMGRFDLARSIELLLDQTDLPIKPFEFALITAVSGLGAGLIGRLVMSRLASAIGGTMLMLLMIAAGGAIPLVWLHIRRALRRQALNRQLPDALQAISSALRSGFGFNQGMGIVASDLPAPISLEFARALREMNLGAPVEEVLQNMARRMQNLDFDLAVSGILINRQLGGNLAELLDKVVATLRERVRLKAFIRVLTAQQRLSAWIVILVPPVVALVLLFGLGQYMKYLFATRAGQVMLLVAVCMQLLGGYFVRRIVSIDV